MALILNPNEWEGECFAFAGRDIILRKDGNALKFDDLRLIKEILNGGDFIEEKEYNYCAMETKSTKNLPEDYMLKPIRNCFAEKETTSPLLLIIPAFSEVVPMSAHKILLFIY